MNVSLFSFLAQVPASQTGCCSADIIVRVVRFRGRDKNVSQFSEKENVESGALQPCRGRHGKARHGSAETLVRSSRKQYSRIHFQWPTNTKNKLPLAPACASFMTAISS